MDKKHGQPRQKKPSDDELHQAAPHGVSFDTEAGRAAQGMRPDIGLPDRPDPTSDPANRAGEQGETESAMGGASDGSSGGGAGAGIPGGGTDMRTKGEFDGGDVEEDRKKLFPPEAGSKPAGE